VSEAGLAIAEWLSWFNQQQLMRNPITDAVVFFPGC
jgi:hypothetical protein